MLILIARLLLLFMTVVWRLAEAKTPPPYRPEQKRCNNATFEYYVRKLGICCSKCKPGTRLTMECTIASDTVCEPCPDGLYMDNMNYYSNCLKCPTCREEKGLMYGTNCSADTKAVCVCKPGMYCSRNHQECEECKNHKTCKPGEGAEKKGTPTADVKCAPCPTGTFSDRSGSEPCRPHTQCEGSAVLRPGNSTDDTVCKMKPLEATSKVHIQTSSKPKSTGTAEMWPMNTISTSTVSVLSSDGKHSRAATTNTQKNQSSPQPDYMIISCITGAVFLLVLLILVTTVVTCKLREREAGLTKVPITDVNKVDQDPSQSSTPDRQHLLHVDRTQTEPSMSSSDSQSQPDCSQSHSSSEWLERNSQDECPSVSSPVVNLSITATFNCQLNPAAASCSIPINPSVLTPHTEAPVPLSQEEVCISSCQQEDGKEALQSVQESGPFLY